MVGQVIGRISLTCCWRRLALSQKGLKSAIEVGQAAICINQPQLELVTSERLTGTGTVVTT